MKTHPTPHRGLSIMVFFAILTFYPHGLTAAEKLVEPATSSDVKPAGYDLQIVGGQLIRPGGKVEATLPSVVDALRDQYTEANIIFSPGLAKLKVGDLKLRAGRLGEELEALRIACGEKFDVQALGGQAFGGPAPQRIDPNTGLPLDLTTGVPITGARSVNAGLFVLREATPPSQKQRVVEAFNIGPYIDWLRHQPPEAGLKGGEEDRGPEQIQRIIKDTIQGFRPDEGEGEQPFFQYHPGASLLIVIGNVDSVEIARKIVNALPGMSTIAEESRGRYGLQTGGMDPSRAAADAAFRARYGLAPRSALPGQPGTAPPDSGSSK
jgi:hypothetical protein